MTKLDPREVQQIFASIKECDDWLVEHSRCHGSVWRAATSGVLAKRSNHLEQLKTMGFNIEAYV